MTLEYENLAIMSKRDARNLAEKLSKGDKEGWNSTAKYEAGIVKMTEKIKLLEANAVKKGDLLIPRDSK